jgi:hypothetical protein
MICPLTGLEYEMAEDCKMCKPDYTFGETHCFHPDRIMDICQMESEEENGSN